MTEPEATAAFDLRLAGNSYRQIARNLGVSVSTAWLRVMGKQRLIADILREGGGDRAGKPH